MGGAKGIPQCKYIIGLTQALGWRTNAKRTRDLLKNEGIYPYVGKEHKALEFFIQQGHDLSHYAPIEEEAKAFLGKHYGKEEVTNLVAKQGQLELAGPDEALQEADTFWPGKRLITRLAKLIKDEPDELKAKAKARKILTQGGYPKPRGGRKKGTWDDEARALRIFQQAGISIEGFEYRNSVPTKQVTESSNLNHIPADVKNMAPQQLKLEIARLTESLSERTAQLRHAQSTLRQTANLLDQTIGTAYRDLDNRRKFDPDARLSRAELLTDVTHREHMDAIKAFEGG